MTAMSPPSSCGTYTRGGRSATAAGIVFEAVAAQTFGGPGVGAGAAAGGGAGAAVGDGAGSSGVGTGVGVSAGGDGCVGVNVSCCPATPCPTAGTKAGALRPVPTDAATGETLATSAPVASMAPSARRYV